MPCPRCDMVRITYIDWMFHLSWITQKGTDMGFKLCKAISLIFWPSGWRCGKWWLPRPLFPDLKGEKVAHLGRLVCKVAASHGIHLPLVQTVRTTVVEVKATTLPGEKKSAVAYSLLHSSLTAEKHYRALEKNKVLVGYVSMSEWILAAEYGIWVYFLHSTACIYEATIHCPWRH